MRVIHAQEIYGTNAIIRDIWNHIWMARVVVADVTDKNPNVNYELGICHALNVPTVLLTKRQIRVETSCGSGASFQSDRLERPALGRQELRQLLRARCEIPPTIRLTGETRSSGLSKNQHDGPAAPRAVCAFCVINRSVSLISGLSDSSARVYPSNTGRIHRSAGFRARRRQKLRQGWRARLRLPTGPLRPFFPLIETQTNRSRMPPLPTRLQTLSMAGIAFDRSTVQSPRGRNRSRQI